MRRIETELSGVCVIEPEVFGDHRGYFMESYSQRAFEELGIDCLFVQDNQSFTKEKGTLRGIHFQNDPMAQAKLVRVIRGAVYDVAVDLRRGSPTYRNWIRVELSAENKRMLFIPRGFGHGFVTLTDNTEFFYKVDNFYSRADDRGIKYNDPTIGVDWGTAVNEKLLSRKDVNGPLLDESDCSFVYEQAVK